MTTTPPPPDPQAAPPATPAPAAAAEQLAPPAASTELQLQAPQPVAAVDPNSAEGMVPLDKAALPGLDKMVSDYVDSIVTLDEHSPEFAQKADSIRTMGDDDIRAAASVSNRMLDAPVKAMSKGGFDAGAQVSDTLLELRRQIEDLDPAKASGVRKLLGIIPFGDKLRDYFHRYESAQTHINAILNALYQGQDELRKDNAVARTGEGASLGHDAAADAVRLRRRPPRQRAHRQDRRAGRDRP